MPRGQYDRSTARGGKPGRPRKDAPAPVVDLTIPRNPEPGAHRWCGACNQPHPIHHFDTSKDRPEWGAFNFHCLVSEGRELPAAPPDADQLVAQLQTATRMIDQLRGDVARLSAELDAARSEPPANDEDQSPLVGQLQAEVKAVRADLAAALTARKGRPTVQRRRDPDDDQAPVQPLPMRPALSRPALPLPDPDLTDADKVVPADASVRVAKQTLSGGGVQWVAIVNEVSLESGVSTTSADVAAWQWVAEHRALTVRQQGSADGQATRRRKAEAAPEPEAEGS